MQLKEIKKLKNELEKILTNNKAIEVKSIDLKGYVAHPSHRLRKY